MKKLHTIPFFPELLGRNLSNSAILAYGVIVVASVKYGYCFASNKYFAELLDRKEDTISGILASLAKEKLIIIQLNSKNREKIIPLVSVGNFKVKEYRPQEKENTDRVSLMKNDEDVEIIDANEVEKLQFLFDADKLFERETRDVKKYIPKLNQRLRTYSLEDLRLAAINIRASDFMMGKTSESKYASIEFLLRSNANIEKWMNMDTAQNRIRGSTEGVY